MSLLETLDDDIADLLGSDNEQSSKQLVTKGQKFKQKVRDLRQKNHVKTNPVSEHPSQTKTNDEERNSKSEKKSSKPKRKKMIYSQSNQSLPSTTVEASDATPIPMSKEEALSLLHSESQKSLTDTVSTTKPKPQSIHKSASNSDLDSDDFDFPSTNTHKPQKHASVSVSDEDSNDSILDWLDEPRANTQRNKRQRLLPPKKKPKQPAPSQATAPVTDSVEQWKEWLELDSNKKEDAEFMHVAVSAATIALPDEWEKVNDNLYHNIKSNERRMTHPLLERMQNELKSLRQKKEAKETKKILLKSTNSIPLSTVKEQLQTNIPLRQIPNDDSSDTESLVPSIAVVTNTKAKDKPEATLNRAESSTLIIKNLRMELNEIRNKYKQSLSEKTEIMEEIRDINNKTEILLNEQRIRLTQSHQLEMRRVQQENDELRALNSKSMSEHQSKLMDLEENCRKDGFAQKERTMTELRLMEDRARKELAHQMELHRATVEELKKQHLNEIEMLNHMHAKQLQNFRQHNKNEGQLNFLISKMETSTLNLHRLQKDIEIERECNQKQRESKISQKEKILSEKDEELIRERKSHRELLERFQMLVEETKVEKTRIRETEDKLKKREQTLLCDLADSNREIHIQRDILNEERRKFELCKTRWNKQKEDELDDIQRLKNEHTKCIQTFYETQEIERGRLAKQRQILCEDKTRLMQIKKEFDVERDALDAHKLEFEQKKHHLEMEQSKFERKVQDVTSLSHRVYQQSELVNKMYTDSKQIEHDNGMMRMQLTAQTKELKMMRQQILMERNQIEKERKMLEQEQLSSLTAKRDLLQQIDSIHAHALQKQQQQSLIHNNNNKQRAKHNPLYTNHPNLQQINSELKELKAFVHECKQNISNYKTDLSHFKHKRESIKSSPLELTNHSHHFNRMSMSFPSFGSNKSSSLRSVKSSLSSALSSTNDPSRVNVTQTPNIIPKRLGMSHNLSALNHTESTLQSSFVSMVNIDTPITIDNKTKKYMNKIKEQQDDNLPLTPTPMPNLSKIHIREEDNQDMDDDDDN